MIEVTPTIENVKPGGDPGAAEEAGIAAESARREAGYYDPTPILKGTRNGTT